MNQIKNSQEQSKSLPVLVSNILNGDYSKNKLEAMFDGDTNKIHKFKSNVISIAGQPLLQYCTPQSIIRSAFALSEVGIDINPVLKQAYVLKYAQDAEPVISYKGWKTLLEKQGKSSRAFCVYKCDIFELGFDSFEGDLVFKPNYLDRDETNRKWFYDNLLGVVVLIKNKNETTKHFVSAKKIEKIKGCSPSVKKGRASPYDEWFEEMYLAKAIKYILSKDSIASSNEAIGKAIELESETESKIQKLNQNQEIKRFDELIRDQEVKDMLIDDYPISMEDAQIGSVSDIHKTKENENLI